MRERVKGEGRMQGTLCPCSSKDLGRPHDFKIPTRFELPSIALRDCVLQRLSKHEHTPLHAILQRRMFSKQWRKV